MGLFKRKINTKKTYNTIQALYILSQPEFRENYTTMEIKPGVYKIITVKESRKLENKIREGKNTDNSTAEIINFNHKKRKDAFRERYQYTNHTAEIVSLNEYADKKQREEKIISFNFEEEREIG